MLVDGHLVVYGGLKEGLDDEDTCPTSEVLVISVRSRCNGRPVGTIPGMCVCVCVCVCMCALTPCSFSGHIHSIPRKSIQYISNEHY